MPSRNQLGNPLLKKHIANGVAHQGFSTHTPTRLWHICTVMQEGEQLPYARNPAVRRVHLPTQAITLRKLTVRVRRQTRTVTLTIGKFRHNRFENGRSIA